jgi:hypothetical protein
MLEDATRNDHSRRMWQERKERNEGVELDLKARRLDLDSLVLALTAKCSLHWNRLKDD